MDLDALDAAALEHAVREVGAFVLVGSGIDTARAAAVLDASRRLFALPQTALDAIAMERSPQFRGYSRAGAERTQGRADLREQLDVGPETPAREVGAGDPPYRRLDGPNLWPEALPELRPCIMDWMDHCATLSARVLDAVLNVLDAPRDAFASAFAPDPHLRLKIVRYPGVPPSPDGQGVGAHSDSGLLALIVQDDAPGLQVLAGGHYVDVVAPPGSLVTVLGRALERATHGRVTPANHRVVSPPPGTSRISVPFFFNPRLDFENGTQRYGESFLEVLLRSHGAVAALHHPDLV